MNVRDKVLSSFNSDEKHAWSHTLPYDHSGCIDCMAWLSVLCGAAVRAKDKEIINCTENYINNLILSGENSRAFAPIQVDDSWIQSPGIPGYWIKKKPQSFAGPAAFYWALKQGANLNTSWVPRVSSEAKQMCMVASVFGYFVRWIKPLEQHVNTFMFAHLLLDKKPPKSMKFLSEGNPLYSWLYRDKCNNIYPTHKTIWPAKLWPNREYPDKDIEYSPVCQLAADYLQSEL
jgi:hypothetical protein